MEVNRNSIQETYTWVVEVIALASTKLALNLKAFLRFFFAKKSATAFMDSGDIVIMIEYGMITMSS